ncbi:TPA: hypothetical protein ACPFP8_003715 [Enterobacter ludwigii]
MGAQVWVVATLLISIALIVLTIVKLKFHPFLALLLASFFVGAMMGMRPLDMVNAIESGIGGTLGFLAAVIGLGTILGKMMEVSGAAERIGIALQRCRWLSADVIMVLVGLICGITLFVEVGVVLLIPLAFSIAKKTHTSLLKLAIPLCTALMAVHCVVPPHPAALFVTNKLGADVGTVIVYGLMVGLLASLVGGPLFLKLLADTLAHILSNLNMHPILLAWLVALVLHAAVGSATVAMMGATAIVAPMLPLYPNVSPEIITIAIGSGAIGCTIVTDSLFWLVKQYCGASLNETLKYYTTATFIASVLALGSTFLLSFII